MKSEKNILIAFILNLAFSIFELIGGTITNSVSIMSDAIHDIGDAISIGISYFLEKKSKKKPDDKYTYGYLRYSIIGSTITTIILIIGSIFVIYNAFNRFINPAIIDYNKMILFATIGVVVNFLATYVTKNGHSLNQKSVNLHMLEDLLGWIAVLIGAIIMKYSTISIIDPILSIIISLYILKNAGNNFKTTLDLFLEKTPNGISINDLKTSLLKIKEVKDIHHIHIWSIDGYNNFATMHIVTNNINNANNIKSIVKEELKKYDIQHTTIELEDENEVCNDMKCEVNTEHKNYNNHHHHNH